MNINNTFNNINNNNNNDNSNSQSEDDSNVEENLKNLNPEDYLYERFGKRGWQCEKCNNFNFEIRTKCNRCGSAMKPKIIKKK